MNPWVEKVMGVDLEHQGTHAGWAVFSGCEGEDPGLVAFFAGPQGHRLADALLAMKDQDGDPLVFDGAMVPALLTGEPGDPGGLVAANHYDDGACIAALAYRHRVDAGRWEERGYTPPESAYPQGEDP